MADRYRVIITPRAGMGLAEIHRYIASDSVPNAALVAETIIAAIDSLEAFPRRHPVYEARRKPSKSVRRMPAAPFLIYYRVDDANRRFRWSR